MSVTFPSTAGADKTPLVIGQTASANGLYVVGIDLGGTKILAGIADANGELLARANENTAHGNDAPVLEQMARMVRGLVLQADVAMDDVACLVIGIPSVVSPETGLASLSPNLALPEDQPLAGLMAERLQCRVVVENDVNLAAFAEATEGAGKGEQSLAFISFGTGVGMGLVIGGELVRGQSGRAGEIGFMPFGADPHTKAPTSENGLFEDTVGTPGIREKYCRDGETVAQLFERAVAGHSDALEDVADIARNSSVGIAAVCSLIDPTLTVIGGGIGSQAIFFEQLKEQLRPLLPFSCRLEQSRFGADAGLIGALKFAQKVSADAGSTPHPAAIEQ